VNRRRVLPVLLVSGALSGVLALAGCTGVPRSSSPEPIQTINDAEIANSVAPPPRGADQRSIVQGFLDANGAADANHNGARAFLTPQARNRWQDQNGATIIDTARVGNVSSKESVVVTGNPVGTLAANGAFTPELSGDGTGLGGDTQPTSRTFQLRKVAGQWRINSMNPAGGLLLTSQEFANQYKQRVLYFYDTTETRLVPDYRWTPDYSPNVLANWLAAQLEVGNTAVPDESNEFPAQTAHVTVTIGRQTDQGLPPTRIDIPGSSQLAPGTKSRLATELAATLSAPAVPGVGDMQITDGGQPVTIPAVHSTTFSAVTLHNPAAEPTPVGAPYYIDSKGQVVDVQGQPLQGRLGQYGLQSIALADRGQGQRGLLAAGVHGEAPHQYVDIGTASKLSTVRLPLGKQLPDGPFSRPDWAPGLKEAWIGDGTQLLSITDDGAVTIVPIENASKVTGQIIAVRFSPDGTRVAIVLKSGPSSQSVYVGEVDRQASGAVQVENLQQISPDQISVQDVGWELTNRLYVIGTDLVADEPYVYSVDPDGAEWKIAYQTVGLLPEAPDSLAVGEGEYVVVTAGTTLWEYNTTWIPLNGDNTRGTSPTYIS